MALVSKSARGKYDRTQSPEQRYEQLHEKLLDDATAVFAARGYNATRVDDLVEHAGISRRTLYQHFDSLEAVLEAVYERAIRTSFEVLMERLRGVTDPIACIRTGVTTYYELIADNPDAARVVFDQYRQAGPAQAAKYALNTTRYATLMLQFLSAAHAAGCIGRAPDELTTYALTKGLEAAGVRALDRGELASLRDIAPAMADLVIAAFSAARP